MKKYASKNIYILLIVFLMLLSFSLNFSIETKASTSTSSLINVQGAQIRTKGTAGIRFVGKVDNQFDITNVTKYGIALAFGEAEVNEVEVGSTVNGKSVLYGEVDSTSLGRYYVNLINIPSSMYGQEITTRAYVVKEGVRVYSDTVTIRTLGEVVLKYKADGNTSELVEEIATYMSKNYKKVFVDELGSVHMDSVTYESNPANLGILFIKDWNKYFETNIDPTTAFDMNGYSSPFSSSAVSSSQTDWSDSKLKIFFQDKNMFSKWGWLLNYIRNELTSGTGYTYVKPQIDAIVNNVEDATNWYYGKHLISYLLSIFNSKATTTGLGNFPFENSSANKQLLGKLINYNQTVYADLSNADVIHIGQIYQLPSIAKESGLYGSYINGSLTYGELSNYIVNDNNNLFIVQYTNNPITQYSITYELNGGEWGYGSKENYILYFLTDFYDFVNPSVELDTFIYGDSTTEYLGTWKNYIGGSVSSTNKLIYQNDLSLNNDSYFFNCSEYKEKWASLGAYVRDYICASNQRFGYPQNTYNYGALDFYRYITNDPAGYINVYTEAFWGYPEVEQPTLFNYTVSNEPIKLPIPVSDLFDGWYLNSDFTGNPITEIPANMAGDLVLYAAWDRSNTFEITFDSDGGTVIDPMTVKANEIVSLPTNINKEGFTFLGWYLGEEKLDNQFMYTYGESIQLVAKWEKDSVPLTNLTYDGKNVLYRGTNTVVQIPTEYVQPEAQLRAAWVTSVAGNFSPSPNEATMKQNLQEILDIFDEYKLNCMIFHVRALNDAYYNTDLAPINSKYGTKETFAQWDYLEWLINECHKRGIEFHAWLNPYRIKSTGYSSTTTPEDVAATYSSYPKNPASKAKNILMSYRSDGTKGAILDPYETEVQDYIVNVCLELMTNYDIDAIHFDDYFYAQMSSNVTVLTEPDQADYETYIDNNPSCGYKKTSSTDKKQWRRDNIDKFIKKLHDAMTKFNIENGRGVQLGIAPTGIYRNGDGSVNSGSNTSGQEHYSSYLFCDTKKWIDNEWIEYIMPQTYWAFTHSTAGYADLIEWWNKVVEGKNVNLYSGLGLYMSIEGYNSWGTQPYEVSNQVLFTTKLKNVKGVSLYSYGSLNTIISSSANIAYQGIQRLKNEYWTEKVPTPTTSASKYIK